ncbi:MAG TPA: methylenetetrahydrofolate reductase [NAD(P)H] [Actinomycetes bacterium]
MTRGTASTMPGGSATVAELLADGHRSFSFEFFPPQTDDGERQLWRALRELEPLAPTFVSVTYGAGGSTRDRTTRLTGRIGSETTLTPMGHLTCVGSSVAELRRVVGGYAEAGVRTVLALRGDPQGGPGTPWVPHPDGLQHADDLVRLVRGLGDFSVGVAAFPEGHPESPDLDTDARHLAAKVAAGADFAVTQFFFRVEDYFRLVERAERHGARVPIIPGIMPVTNVRQIQRFAQLSGAALPGELAERLTAVQDDPEAVRAIGVEAAVELCEQLLDGGAPGLHFYTLNRSTATREIYQALGLHHRAARR